MTDAKPKPRHGLTRPKDMGIVQVRLFAGPREAVGAPFVRVELPPEGTPLVEFVNRLVAAYPALAPWRGSALVSVNREFAQAAATVAPGDEVAFMPPVSGGAGDARVWDGPLSVDGALAGLDRAGAGAAVAFLGIVRDSSKERPGARVDRLEFEAYAEMANPSLERVTTEAVKRFGLVDAGVRHRVGTLETGEDIVLVVVTAAHRKEAFEAAQWIMDALKTDVPVWKKEVGPDGAAWVNDSQEDPS